MRLKRILQPSSVQRLLEAVVTRALLVPREWYQVRDPAGFPESLRRVVARTASTERVWSAWTDGHRISLFTSEMSLDLSRERGAPVIQVAEYHENGELRAAGHWLYDKAGAWRRCAE